MGWARETEEEVSAVDVSLGLAGRPESSALTALQTSQTSSQKSAW